MSYKPPKDELLEAVDLAAVYYTGSAPGAVGTLRIIGNFQAVNPVDFPHFERKPWLGAIRYEVHGLVYNPAVEEYTRAIHDHDSSMILPNPALPGSEVIIGTSKGDQPVTIRWVEGPAPPLEEMDASRPSDDPVNGNGTQK